MSKIFRWIRTLHVQIRRGGTDLTGAVTSVVSKFCSMGTTQPLSHLHPWLTIVERRAVSEGEPNRASYSHSPIPYSPPYLQQLFSFVCLQKPCVRFHVNFCFVKRSAESSVEWAEIWKERCRINTEQYVGKRNKSIRTAQGIFK